MKILIKAYYFYIKYKISIEMGRRPGSKNKSKINMPYVLASSLSTNEVINKRECEIEFFQVDTSVKENPVIKNIINKLKDFDLYFHILRERI